MKTMNMKSNWMLLGLSLLGLGVLTQCETAGGGGAVGGGKRAALAAATKEAPWVNGLGMKFVPVAGTKVLFCTTETTVAQYQAAGLGYSPPPFPQDGNHPAVNVSWNDAKAWCAAMSKRDGVRYRLPTEVEWNAAVGSSTYPWGYTWPPPNNAGNYMGMEHMSSAASVAFFRSLGHTGGLGVIAGFRDNHVFTAPVGSYPANSYGIHDLGGNVWEWCEDARVLRGGSWSYDGRDYLASSGRYYVTPGNRLSNYGFRCVVVR
jgi:formylglycine-generating enzyme required for sulfatase activity